MNELGTRGRVPPRFHSFRHWKLGAQHKTQSMKPQTRKPKILIVTHVRERKEESSKQNYV